MNIKRLSIIIIFAIIIITVFSIIAYKILKKGNNINNKSEEEIVNSILNLKGYKAKIEIEIETNKNKTKYKIEQSLENGNISKQEIIEPENIKGVVTEYDGNNLRIYNNNMNLSTTYENYSYIVDNSLWLNSFIEDYKTSANSKITKKENTNEIILEVKNEKTNKYNVYKKLIINQNTGKPIKMIVKDINQKTLIYILYNEIDIS